MYRRGKGTWVVLEAALRQTIGTVAEGAGDPWVQEVQAVAVHRVRSTQMTEVPARQQVLTRGQAGALRVAVVCRHPLQAQVDRVTSLSDYRDNTGEINAAHATSRSC